MNESAHARNLPAGRQSEPLACYAITKCVGSRRPVLGNARSAGIILDSLDFLRRDERIRLLGFCVMPDHIHLLFVLMFKSSLKNLMRDFCRFPARKLNQSYGMKGEFWHDDYYDHRCRNEDDVIERLAYIEHNPVRAGLVAKAEDWLYSSAHPANGLHLDRDWYAKAR